MSVILNLYELQQADNEITKKEKRVLEIEHVLSDDSELKKLESLCINKEEKKAGILKEQKELEFDLGGVAEKYDKDKSALYGGQVRNPKELEALQKDAESLKARLDKLEIKDLELMELLDQAQKELEQLALKLKNLKAKRAEEFALLNEEKSGLEGSLKKIYVRRKALREAVDAPTITLYDQIKKKKGRWCAI